MPLDWLLAGGAGAAWWAASRTAAREADTLDDIDGDPTMMFSARVQELARAIARAEGFGAIGAIPTVAHNPGDLALGDVGNGVLGKEHITVFATDADGWLALYKQLQLIADGRSHVYTRSMTIADMASHYAPGAQAVTWAANVAAILGVSVTTTLHEVLG